LREDQAKRARSEAVSLLAEGTVGDRAARELGKVGQAVPVSGPSDELHSWLVPVSVKDKLVAWVQLLPDLQLLRYSTFLTREDETGNCPKTRDWFDPETISRKASAMSKQGETLGEPRLTYAGSPSKLAWAVEASDSQGNRRTIMVAGDAVFEAQQADEPVFGGPPGG
jgi:hypothetical protein